MFDIFYLGQITKYFDDLKQRIPTIKHVSSFSEAKKKCLTKFFWIVPDDVIVLENFDFSYTPDNWSEEYIHVFKNGEFYDGIFLISKHVNVENTELIKRNFLKNKKVELLASNPKQYDVFEIDTYEEYLHALENSTTEMFWMSSRNIEPIQELIQNYYISHHDDQLRNQTHAFIHQINSEKLYNGLFLCSKHAPLSKKEVEYRFPVNRIEHDIVGSGPKQYDVFEIDTYEEYLHALENSTTELFWIIPNNVIINNNFKFDIYFTFDNKYDREINHAFLNGKYFDGILLCSKYSKISEREWKYKFILNKKEHNILASNPKSFDIVFISYQEPNANENYQKLIKRFPNAKHIKDVKGIHRAHVAAANICNTDLFYVVDGDAKLLDSFDFNYQVAEWDKETVHVWQSINPINGLVYGYGGVKLLPKSLTLRMDLTKLDMSTSISNKFKVVEQISNITAFNTDPFNTWKSAFRECVKLASGLIDRQDDTETENNLRIWTSVGGYKKFGDYAIKGAIAGAAYGKANRNNLEALKLINDFEWLKLQFKEA